LWGKLFEKSFPHSLFKNFKKFFCLERGINLFRSGVISCFCSLTELLAYPIITLEVPRLARSTKQLCEIIERVRVQKLRLVIVGSITVDCTKGELDPMTNAFIQMSGVFAELELRIIRARVKSGMANAKAKGAHRQTAAHKG